MQGLLNGTTGRPDRLLLLGLVTLVGVVGKKCKNPCYKCIRNRGKAQDSTVVCFLNARR